MSGYFDLPWWGYVLAALALTHITIVSVTIFLHRHQAHHALTLHPITSHFFRFWLWLTTGIVTKEWVSIHRKHHVKCETPEDSHSPQVFGLSEILLKGAEYYQAEAKKTETLETYGRGTPDDWIEHKLYSRYPSLGIGLMMVIDLIAFGPIGLAGWALLLLGILKRSRIVALLGLGAVVADVTIAELGGFKAMNETRPAEPASSLQEPVEL